MTMQEIITRKRDGYPLTPDQITFFVGGYTGGTIPDYQASALLMAIYLRGMDGAETDALTIAMAQSGQTLDLSSLPPGRPTLDKHSTGGVGDKTSLVVVPILAAAGASVCKMSGRGLGHTGGTLDKLEAIPGFRVDLTPGEMIAQVGQVGACLAGQTGDLAPADKKIYALRDSTATVGCLPLIVSSILSKKLAGGAGRFLFDVKVGTGALMPTPETARALAHALVDGATRQGRRAVAVLSDMNEPLGNTVGNALEVAEAIYTLTPHAPAEWVNHRFRELCLRLAAQGLVLCDLSSDPDAAYVRAQELLDNGAALATFRAIVMAQGGDSGVVDSPERLPRAPVIVPVNSPQGGYIVSVNAAALGEAVVRLGGGRSHKEDTINPAVGLTIAAGTGDYLAPGAEIAHIHAADAAGAEAAQASVLAAYTIAAEVVDTPPLISQIIGG